MSLEDHYNDLEPSGDEAEEHPWRADWEGAEGTIQTGALPDDFDPHDFSAVLHRLGYSPDEVKMELVSASRWEQRTAVRDDEGRKTGEMASTYLNAYKYKAVRNALCVPLPALYAEVKASKPTKNAPSPTGRTRWHIQASTLDNGSAWVRNKMGEDGDPAMTVFVVDQTGFDVQSFSLL